MFVKHPLILSLHFLAFTVEQQAVLKILCYLCHVPHHLNCNMDLYFKRVES